MTGATWDRARAGLLAFEEYAVYAVIFSLPLQAVSLVPGTSWTLTKVGGALLAASVVARRLGDGRKTPFGRTGLESALFLFALACLFSLPGSINRATSTGALITFAQYGLVFYAFAHATSRERIQRRLPALMVGACALSGLGAAFALVGRIVPPTVDAVIPNSNIRRVCFGLLDANEQALFFLFAMSFLLAGGMLWRGRRGQALAGGACIAVAVGLALTMSRSGWLCAGALIGLRALLDRNRVRYCAGLLALAVAAAAALAVVKPEAITLVKRRVVEAAQTGDRSLASRLVHYTEVVEAAREGGPFGHGLGTTYELSEAFRTPLGTPIGVTVHSVPFMMWLDLGWVGLLCWGWLWSCVLALLYAGLRRAGDGPERERVLAYCMMVLAYGAVSLVMPFVFRSSLPILLGCIVGALSPTLLASSEKEGVLTD